MRTTHLFLADPDAQSSGPPSIKVGRKPVC
jgi:hypothetical protein